MANQPIITTEWLCEHLSDSNLRVVDIRGHVAPATDPLPHYFNHQGDYLQSHIPGAVFVDWVHEITDPDDPRHAQIAKPERYAAVMSRLGIAPDTLVVAYDDAEGMFAARLWWSLNYYGHANVVVLDGGWKKWIAEGRPVTAEIPMIQPINFVAKANPDIRRTGEQVLANLDSVKLLDLRTLGEFNGEASRAKRFGHIPGAANVPRTSLNNPDGTMLAPEQLRLKFESLGLDDSTDVVTYCNGGVSGSYGFLALRVAGLDNISLYDGSWKDWGNDDTKPIE